jgi:4'-phosphopantetheinyl transferase EntD
VETGADGRSTALLLEGLLDPEIRIAAVSIEDRTGSLRPEERAQIAGARPSRQWEFASGRWLARRLLGSLGHAEAPILRAEDRSPVWPDGIVGSITHSGTQCVVALARASIVRAIGLDLEPDAPVKDGLDRLVCRDEERAFLESPDPDEGSRRCRVVFSVKEAVYKAFYPTTRRVWGFQEVGVSIDLAREAFVARLPPDAGLVEVAGRVHRRRGWILAGVALRA